MASNREVIFGGGMKSGRNHSFAKCALALVLGSMLSVCLAAPIITLPVGEVTRLSYTGQERFNDTNNNNRPDVGEVFEGVASVTGILGATSGADFSSQLANKEITAHFHFTVTGHSNDFSHLEFGLLPGDFFNLYVGQGASKNFDPSASDADARASDGQLWLGIQPGPFFESVNDRQPDGSTLNRAWADITANNTGYLLPQEFLRALLGSDPQHFIGTQSHGDHAVQAIFDNRVAGFSPYFPRFTFSIFGELDIFAVPEPATWLLILVGMATGIFFAKPGGRLQRKNGFAALESSWNRLTVLQVGTTPR